MRKLDGGHSLKKLLGQPRGEHASAVGRIAPGNIALGRRPRVRNPKGGTSTVLSTSFSERKGGPEILVPRVVGRRVVSEQAAVRNYYKTGKRLGIYSSVAAANRYAENLHREQARRVGRR